MPEVKMDKKLLVLGIGPAQVDLIKIAKEMGLTVYACAHSSAGPGRELVDDFRQIDIKNQEAVKDYAKEMDVDFIYTMALEFAVPTISKVSEELGLPTFCSTESLSKFTSKARWREILGDLEGNVRHQSGHSLEAFQSWDIYPAIIKPVDSSGQRGVHKVDNYDQVKDIFDESIKHSSIKELIMEDYIDGPEVSVNSFMYKGELAFAIVSDRISYSEYPGGIIKEHHIPSKITSDEMEEKIKFLVGEVNKKMGFENGHVYFQLKIQDNEPYVIEFTPRFDACHMWRLIQVSTGLDLRRVSLEVLATGRSSSLENYEYSLKAHTTRFISDKPATIVDKSNYDIPENTLYLEWYYNDGDKVNTITGYMEKVGYMIIAE